jgi:hypothetical protein
MISPNIGEIKATNSNDSSEYWRDKGKSGVFITPNIGEIKARSLFPISEYWRDKGYIFPTKLRILER